MSNSGKKLIVVLGMHRSGTSTVTRSLQVMGVELGDRLMAALENNNAKGFWEDIDVNALNIEILGVPECWHDLVPLRAEDFDRLRRDGYVLRAVELLREKMRKTSVFGIKDPRLAMLLPFWQEVFLHCGLDVAYVLPVRHPLSVAKSLAKRDQLEHAKSYLLWLRHVVNSLMWTVGTPRVLVDYDRFLDDPEAQLTRMADGLGLSINAGALSEFRESFLDHSLRHSLQVPGDLLLDSACHPLVGEVYGTLLEVAMDRMSVQDNLLDEKCRLWSAEVARLFPVLELIDTLVAQKALVHASLGQRDQRLDLANQSAASCESQMNLLSQALAEREGQGIAAHQAVVERDERIIALEQTVAQREAQIGALDQVVFDRDARAQQQSQMLAENERQLFQEKAAVADLSAQLAGQRGQVDVLKQALGDLRNSLTWRLSQPLRDGLDWVFGLWRTMTNTFWSGARRLYSALPVSASQRAALSACLFRSAPLLFRGTPEFKHWQASRRGGQD